MNPQVMAQMLRQYSGQPQQQPMMPQQQPMMAQPHSKSRAQPRMPVSPITQL